MCEGFGRPDAMLVKEFHIVACRTVEEIICPHAQPEQIYLIVGTVSLFVYIRDIRRSKRTIRAEIREFVEMAQPIGQRLIATTREPAYGTMVSIIDGTIISLDIRHQIFVQIIAEEVALCHRIRRRLIHQFYRISIR